MNKRRFEDHKIKKLISKNTRYFLAFGFLLLFMSCNVFSQESAPYLINGEFVMDENSPDYSICGVNIFLMNKSEKEIKKMNIVFFLFDQDGEPAYECRSKISVEIEESLPGGDSCNFCISLDRFLSSIPEAALMVDYLYLARIDYMDGSSWEDPYGLVAFK